MLTAAICLKLTIAVVDGMDGWWWWLEDLSPISRENVSRQQPLFVEKKNAIIHHDPHHSIDQ